MKFLGMLNIYTLRDVCIGFNIYKLLWNFMIIINFEILELCMWNLLTFISEMPEQFENCWEIKHETEMETMETIKDVKATVRQNVLKFVVVRTPVGEIAKNVNFPKYLECKYKYLN